MQTLHKDQKDPICQKRAHTTASGGQTIAAGFVAKTSPTCIIQEITNPAAVVGGLTAVLAAGGLAGVGVGAGVAATGVFACVGAATGFVTC